MASITARKDRDNLIIGWQVRVRKKGYPLQVKTFDKKVQAQAWARQIETEMDRGIALPAGNPVLNVRMPAPSKPRDRRL